MEIKQELFSFSSFFQQFSIGRLGDCTSFDPSGLSAGKLPVVVEGEELTGRLYVRNGDVDNKEEDGEDEGGV